MSPMEHIVVPIAPEGTVVPGPASEAPPSFGAFFEEHHPGLFRALWLVSRNRHEAEEVMQDAFLRLWERWGRISRLESPEGYLYRTAMNLFRSRVRRAKVALRKAAGGPRVDDKLKTVEERDELVRALAVLSPMQRAALVLTEYLGLSSGEAGRTLRINASTVRVHVTRARATLDRELGDRDA